MRRTVLLLVTVAVFFMLFMDVGTAAGSYVWPVEGKVLVPYEADGHRGVDIACGVGDSVVSAKKGSVIWIGKTPRGESCVTIEHPDSVSSTYLPVDASVKKGQKVESGDIIGTISTEGDPSSTETHLHFGLYDTATRSDKVYLNPADYLPELHVHLSSDGKNKAVDIASEHAAEQKLETIPLNDISAKAPKKEPFVPESITVLDGQADIVGSGLSVSNGDRNTSVGVQVDRDRISANATDINKAKASIIKTGNGHLTVPEKDTYENSMIAKSTLLSTTENGVSGKINAGAASQKDKLIIDNTFHGAEKEITLNSKVEVYSQSKMNNSGYEPVRVFNNRTNQIGQHVENSQVVSRMHAVDSQTYVSNLSTKLSSHSGRKQDVIESINPFVVKKAGQARSSNTNLVLNKVQEPGEPKNVHNASHQEQQGVSGLICRAFSWDGLPDAVAALAIAGIAILSSAKLIRNSRIIGDVMKTSSATSC